VIEFPDKIYQTLKVTEKMIFPNIYTALEILAVLPITTCEASLKRISTEFLGGSFKSICALHFENTTVLHLQSYAILQFCSEINWVVAATGYSPIYDSDSIMKVFGNNLLE